MRMYDLIKKKKHGVKFTAEEIKTLVQEYTAGDIPDYQMSALLMAVWFNGLDAEETKELTMAMASSGEQVDLSAIDGIKVDKHSSGGVGDKTTLVVAPLAAACGAKVAKMSGRGLGHTGGTIDKLESIPGYRTALSEKEFFDVVQKCGVSVIGQSRTLAPADKKMYALRDVTATVDSMPLIASSIMSKKIASGSDAILLDVKVGSGAFMKTVDEALTLAKTMVEIGTMTGRNTVALLTDMNVPLGNAIGNAIEVREAVETLKGKGPADFRQECLSLTAEMLCLAGKGTVEACRTMAQEALDNGKGFAKLVEMVRLHGGDTEVLLQPEQLALAPYTVEILAPEDGYISSMDAEVCGATSVILGAGREREDFDIDMGAGIYLWKKIGDYVKKGDPLARLYTSRKERLQQAQERMMLAYAFLPKKPPARHLIYARVTKDGVTRYDK